MRAALLLLIARLSVPACLAQAPLSAVSTVEIGWSSNISATAGGAADFYFRRDHDLSLRGSIGALDLRAGLQLEQMRFLAHPGEDDLEVTAGIEAGLPLAQNITLRMGYAATRSWTGTMVPLAGLPVDVLGTGLDHELLAELVMSGDGQALVLGVDGILERPGTSTLGELPLPPTRLDPEITTVTVRLDGEWTAGQVIGLGRANAVFTRIPVADQIVYRREPIDGLRLAGGMRHQSGGGSMTVYLGADTVWPQNAPYLIKAVPYADVQTELLVHPNVALSASGTSAVVRDNPLDGIAGHMLDGEIGIRLALGEQLSVSAASGLSRESGLYAPRVEQWRRMANAVLDAKINQALSVTLSMKQEWIDAPAGAYTVSRIGFGLTGRI